MSAPTAVRVEGLGKSYTIGHFSNERSTTLREAIVRSTGSFLRKLRDMFSGRALVLGDTTEEFRALDNISFEIAKGEIVGVIGRNGAGKSTLLKVLSRITEPTDGRIEISGRVSSLLEVGTGFHPELTGRENIYLNGAIIGMKRAEIRRKFDEIVAFAGVSKFLDTPVKRYSSGMYVRLAFSVAAHLEPEIMIVDEVLAVGDQEFQNKCLGKMRDVASAGRTVLFVSHNLHSVASLCTRVIAMSQGGIVDDGAPGSVIEKYLHSSGEDVHAWSPDISTDRPFRYSRVAIVGAGVPPGANFLYDQPIVLEFEYDVSEDLPAGRLAFSVINEFGASVLSSADTDDATSMRRKWQIGSHIARCTIPGKLLSPGRYLLTFSEPSEGGDILHDGLISFTIGAYGSPGVRDGRRDVISPLLPWETVIK